MIRRAINLPALPTESFFLWGPRKAGKTTLLEELYPDSLRYDLLKTDLSIKYTREPYRLREEILAFPSTPSFAIIDEVQKVPALL